jgi:hypothetical protein
VEPENFHPAGEGIGQFWNQQHVGGSSQQEPARLPIPVHRKLYDGEEGWDLLHLVEDDFSRQIGHEPRRVVLGHRQHDGIIEAEVGVAQGLAHLARQGRLAALPGPMDEDHRRVGQGQRQLGGGKAGMEGGGHTVQS